MNNTKRFTILRLLISLFQNENMYIINFIYHTHIYQTVILS